MVFRAWACCIHSEKLMNKLNFLAVQCSRYNHRRIETGVLIFGCSKHCILQKSTGWDIRVHI